MPTLAPKARFRVPRIPDRDEVARPFSLAPADEDQPKGPSTSTPPSPALLHDIIEDYLTLSLPLTALARRHNLSFTALADILDDPDFQTLLTRLNRLATQRADALAIHARACSINSLESTLATTTDPECARKAATSLVRISDRVLYPPRRSTKRTNEPHAQKTGEKSVDSQPTGAQCEAPDPKPGAAQDQPTGAQITDVPGVPDSN